MLIMRDGEKERENNSMFCTARLVDVIDALEYDESPNIHIY